MKAKKHRPAKRRLTGNGTANVQWLYVMWNVPFVWVCKVGIGGSLRKRERQVDRSAPGLDLVIFALPIPFAYQVEQLIHYICAPLRVKFWGSGHTERFFVLAVVPAVLLALCAAVVAYGSMALLLFSIFKSIS